VEGKARHTRASSGRSEKNVVTLAPANLSAPVAVFGGAGDAPEIIYRFAATARAMVPLQIPGGPELFVLVLALGLNLLVLVGVLGGLGYFLLRIRSGGSVSDRLNRIERKIGRLEAQVEQLQDDDEA
jgi:hypothetical protein